MSPPVETLLILGKRLGWMLLTLWIVYTFSFFLMREVPGGPFSAEKKVQPSVQRQLEARFRMDKPRIVQYFLALRDATIFFDFGPSMRMEDYTVNEVIAEGFPVSATLGILALVLAMFFGMTAGVISAVRRNTVFDFGFMLLATVGIAVPNFVLASLSIILIVFWLQLVPAAGWGSIQQAILPALCVAAPYAAYIARLTRAGMLEVLNLDYIRTAYAKGLAPRTVIVKHALRGAILPVVSYLGPATAGILTGSLVLEKIFNVPGMGSFFIDAAMQRDYTLALGMVVVYTALLLVMNTLVDLSYAIIDPRVKMEWLLSAVETPPAPSRERYQALLGEAAQIRGISLWKDAWRRLKKNWAAMGSLGFLCVLALLAFFTPLLPLQSPQHQIADAKHKYQAPSFTPASLGLNREALTRLQREIDELTDKLRPMPRDSADLKSLEAQLESKRREHPLQRLWNKPGFLTRLLLRARLATFGTWSIPSLCGRDELGRDVLARIFWGARVSIIVGLVATLVSLSIGVSYGAVSGYLGGVVDVVMMRIVDILYSIPFIFIVIFLITILSEDSIKARLARFGIDQIVIFYFVIGAIYWLTMARVVRGQIISLKHEQFVDAARTIGAGTPRIVFRHLIPNVLGIVIVYLTLTIPSVMLFEAFLSFLGLGVQPPDVSWGLLMSEGLKVITPLEMHWWLVVFPGIALALTLFALNFLGDGLRDALDPRMKNR